jgi:predicted pyridoxine 5'-phosphate oxidase superfamily flavin-nucleotide-binding protein
MQKDNDNSGRIITSVEVVDVPPIETESYVTTSTPNELAAGVTQLTNEEVYQFFKGRNLAFLSTLSKDGSPHITPVWAEMVDDLILINTFETSAKNKHITDDKRIALSVVEQNNPFNMVSIKGRRLAKRYLGIGKYYYRKPNHKRIIIKIRPEKIMGLSIHPAFYFLAYSPWTK